MSVDEITVFPGFRVLGFSALPGFRALKAGDGAWSVHKTLFGFRAPISQLFYLEILEFLLPKSLHFSLFTAKSLLLPFLLQKDYFRGGLDGFYCKTANF